MAPDSLASFGFAGGLLAGFASSLHCVGMCGGIAAGLTAGFAREGRRAEPILLMQTGRILAYVTAGIVLAALGSSAYFAFDREVAHLVLRWAAGAVLVYIGFSVAGWAPSLAGLDRIGYRVAGFLEAPLGLTLNRAGPVLAGFVWGFMPCGMVYATLFYAMLSADPMSGALIMLGFGFGTLPAVTATAFGAEAMMRAARRTTVRIPVGLAIAGLGIASAAIPWKTIAALCGIPVD